MAINAGTLELEVVAKVNKGQLQKEIEKAAKNFEKGLGKISFAPGISGKGTGGKKPKSEEYLDDIKDILKQINKGMVNVVGSLSAIFDVTSKGFSDFIDKIFNPLSTRRVQKGEQYDQEKSFKELYYKTLINTLGKTSIGRRPLTHYTEDWKPGGKGGGGKWKKTPITEQASVVWQKHLGLIENSTAKGTIFNMKLFSRLGIALVVFYGIFKFVKGMFRVLSKGTPALGSVMGIFETAIDMVLRPLAMWLTDAILPYAVKFLEWSVAFATSPFIANLIDLLFNLGTIIFWIALYPVRVFMGALAVLGDIWDILTGKVGILEGLFNIFSDILTYVLPLKQVANIFFDIVSILLGLNGKEVQKRVGSGVNSIFGKTIGGGINNILGLPTAASGGITRGPTIAGEAGAEAIIPLNKMGSIGTTNVNVYIDGKEFRGMIREEIRNSRQGFMNSRPSW